MSRVPWLVLVLLVTGCGAPERSTGERAPGASGTASSSPSAGSPSRSSTASPMQRARAQGTTVTVDDSPFGRMLFDHRGQAIYLFEPEAAGPPACYGECEKDWPPVLTRGRPVARDGLRPALLGTVERRDGDTQVTYGGWPLYSYAHEDPGEVLCHDVVLNGGLWLAIGTDGEGLPT